MTDCRLFQITSHVGLVETTLGFVETSVNMWSILFVAISAADLPNNSLTAERAPSNTAGGVIVHGFGDSCAIIAALS